MLSRMSLPSIFSPFTVTLLTPCSLPFGFLTVTFSFLPLNVFFIVYSFHSEGIEGSITIPFVSGLRPRIPSVSTYHNGRSRTLSASVHEHDLRRGCPYLHHELTVNIGLKNSVLCVFVVGCGSCFLPVLICTVAVTEL